MIQYKIGRSIACALALVVVAAAYAQPDPQQIAQRCIAAIGEAATNAGDKLNTVSTEAVARIDQFQAAGDQQAAVRVANIAQERIRTIGHRAVNVVQHLARHCVAALTRLNAPAPLIQSVRDAAQTAVSDIAADRAAASQAVRDALTN